MKELSSHKSVPTIVQLVFIAEREERGRTFSWLFQFI